MSTHNIKAIATSLGLLCTIGLIFLPFLSNGVFFWHGHSVLDTALLGIEAIVIGLILLLPNFKKFFLGEQDLLYSDISVLLFTLLYIIATSYAASVNLAVQGALDTVALLVPYFLFRFSRLRNLFAPWIGTGFVLASIPIVVIGLANGWGQLTYPSATELTPQHRLQIASVFQYHNAFAVFTASIAVGLLVWVARTTSQWMRTIAIGIAALNITGLILSGSRGALAIWLVVIILVLIGLRSLDEDRHKIRNQFMANSYLAGIASVIGYILAHHANDSKSPMYGWAGIVLAFVIPVVYILIRGFVIKQKILLHGRKGLTTWIGIGIVLGIIGAAFKSHALIAKIESYHIHQLSVVQRFIFWGDGFKIFIHNPVSGLGAGAWQAMYQKVQSYPYVSSKVHSFGMDVLMEAGLLGLLCLIVFIWPVIRATVWPNREQLSKSTPTQMAFIAAGLMLFVHSLMDWDMSFEFLMILFFAAVGSAAAHGSRLQTKSVSLKRTNFILIPLSVLSLIGVLTTSLGLKSEAISHQAQLKGGTNASKLFLSAFHLAPYNDAYLSDAAITLLQGNPSKNDELTAESWIQHAERLNPYSPTIASNFAHLSYTLGNYDVTFRQARLAMDNAPFDPRNVSLALTAGTVDGLREASSNPTAAKVVFEQVVHAYNLAMVRQKVVSELPSYLPPSMPYQLDPFSLVSVAASKYVLGDPSGATSLAVNQLHAKELHAAEVGKLIVLMVNEPNQVQSYVTSTPSVKSSYQLLVAALQSIK